MPSLFQPDAGAGQTLNVTSSSSSAALPLQAESMYIYNAGTGLVFVRWGKGAQTAVPTDLPLPPGSVQTFGKEGADTIAMICPSGTATVYVNPGEGG